MLTLTNVAPYTGIWHLYSSGERNPLGYTADVCARIDALSRLRGSHFKFDFDPPVTPILSISAARECFTKIRESCQFETFLRDPLNEVIVIDIATPPTKTDFAELTLCRMALLGHETRYVAPFVIDLDRLVMERARPTSMRVALFSAFGAARYRLMCNMHNGKDAVDSSLEEASIALVKSLQNPLHGRTLRQVGHVAAPVTDSDLAAFPMRLLLRDWDHDVKRLIDSGFFKDLGTWLDTELSKGSETNKTDLPPAEIGSLLLHDNTAPLHNIAHTWTVAGYNELCIRAEFTTNWIFHQPSFHAIITVQYGDSFLESLFPSNEVAQISLTSTSRRQDEPPPSIHAIIGAALSVETRVRALHHHVCIAMQDQEKYHGCTISCRSMWSGRLPKSNRLERAEQAFGKLIYRLTNGLFFGDFRD